MPPTETPSTATPPGTPAQAQAGKSAGQKRDYFAHTHILHDGKTIRKGSKLPPNFPPDSLKQLIEEKAVHHLPPGPATTLTQGADAAATDDGDAERTDVTA